MKYVTFLRREQPTQAIVGAMLGEVVIDLHAAQTWAQGVRGMPPIVLPDNMLGFLHAGSPAWEHARALLDALQSEDPRHLKGAGRKPVGYSLSEVHLLAPLPHPLSLRDFYAFEAHVAKAYANRHREVPPEWYQFPVFYFSNANAIYGPGHGVPYPTYSQALDYELEVACVIGKPGINIRPEKAQEHIFGYLIFNDWSARDVQRQEMRVGLGPAKGKDFASSLGPWIVTPDELADKATEQPGVYDLAMVARVNGKERSRGRWCDIHYSFGELLARASQDVLLLPGEIIGSGTVGSGCLLELTAGEGPWLQPGDIVELEIERLGILANQVFATQGE